jgi:hypothetical protein
MLKVITIRKPWGYEEMVLVDGALVRGEDLRELLSAKRVVLWEEIEQVLDWALGPSLGFIRLQGIPPIANVEFATSSEST